MAVSKVKYCYVKVPNRTGQGAKILSEIKKKNLNLLAYSGFPTTGGKAQLDFIARNLAPMRKIARDNDLKLSPIKKGFLIQGNDRLGAVHRHMQKLADRKINVTAADAVCAGKGRYGMLLWVKPKDYAKAARALKAK